MQSKRLAPAHGQRRTGHTHAAAFYPDEHTQLQAPCHQQRASHGRRHESLLLMLSYPARLQSFGISQLGLADALRAHCVAYAQQSARSLPVRYHPTGIPYRRSTQGRNANPCGTAHPSLSIPLSLAPPSHNTFLRCSYHLLPAADSWPTTSLCAWPPVRQPPHVSPCNCQTESASARTAPRTPRNAVDVYWSRTSRNETGSTVLA